MRLITTTLISVIFIILLIYLIYYFVFSSKGEQLLIRDITPLNSKKDVLYSDQAKQMLLASSGSTVMAFFKLNGGDRTIKYQGSFNPILQVENNWYLEIAPAPSNKNTAARLLIKTSEGNETIDLPTIPQQKWVFIAILREGRRFDIIYDNQIVASQRLKNYPVVINSPLSIGNSAVDGSIVNLTVINSRLSPLDVERRRASNVNTNGDVIQDNIIIKSLSIPSLSFNISAKCPPGLPCDSITKAPDGLREWSSPYA